MTRRVLVTRLDGAGDVLLAGPAVRAVAAGPDTEVTVLCGPAGEAAARLLPGVGAGAGVGEPVGGEPGAARSTAPPSTGSSTRSPRSATPRP